MIAMDYLPVRRGERDGAGLAVNEVSREVIGAAIEVHRDLGPGLLERCYEEALCHELHSRGLKFLRQHAVSLSYKGVKLSVPFSLDLLVEGQLVVELKAKEQVTSLDKTQLRTYIRLSHLHVGLLINFNVECLTDGVTRVVNQLLEVPDDDPPADFMA